MFDLLTPLLDFVPIAIALLLAVTVHEFCHAWAATLLGDPTAKYMGRLTLNPMAHLDPLGTLSLIVAGFGWGKPVPFSMNHLKNPRLDSALIALAGPLSNFALALIFALPFRYLVINFPDLSAVEGYLIVVMKLMKTIIEVNLVLMIFNLLPLPPLDGSKIFSLLIPGDYISRMYQLRNYGYVLLLVLAFSPQLFGINILGGYILYPLMNFFWDIVLFGM